MLGTNLTAVFNRQPLLPIYLAFSLAYLVLAMNLPVSIFTDARHDDALFWGNALHIVEGNWLGPYSQMTLAKGPGFPLFLAANAVFGTPVTLLIALLYVFACGLTANTLVRLGLNKYLVLLVFATILFHPALFPTRIIRDNIYPALSLIAVSGIIRMAIPGNLQGLRIASAIFYGLVFGLFWVTREEGVWIVPGIAFFLLLKVLQLKKQKLPVKDIVYRFASFSLAAILFVSLLAAINYHKYGKFEVVDFKGQAFTQAFNALISVDVGEDLPFVPVSFEKRQAIYKISPSFSQLKDYLEVKGKGMTTHGCKYYSWTCGDYAGGWFMWALRAAAASKGYYSSPTRAAEFYNNLTEEIKTACNNGVIKCRSRLVPYMPNVTTAQLKEIPDKVLRAIKLAMVQLAVPATGVASRDPLNQLQSVRTFLGNPLTTPTRSESLNAIQLNGWFYSEKNDWIELSCLVDGERIKRSIDRKNSPGIAEHFKDPNANFQRFSISVAAKSDCSISTISSPSNNFSINSLLGKQKASYKVGENGRLHFDKIMETNPHAVTDSARDLPVTIKKTLANIYKFILPAFVLIGAIVYSGYLLFLLIGKANLTDVFIVTTTLWCLFLSRIALIVLVGMSSFPAIDSLYMSAAFPILCLAALVSLHLIAFRKRKNT